MDDVVPGLHLGEGRRNAWRSRCSVEDAPVCVVVVDRVRSPVPDQPTNPAPYRSQVREDAGTVEGVAHRTACSGLALVGRVREEDVVVVGPGNVDGAFRPPYDEEEMRNAVRIQAA